MKAKICPICGESFTPATPADKYCSAGCREKGIYSARKEWEARSDFLEKQRQRMRDYRAARSRERAAERETAAKQRNVKHNERLEQQRKQREALILQAAREGDPAAQMTIARQESGVCSLEYWRAFQRMELKAESKGRRLITSVNGIDVRNPDFPLGVVLSIEELNVIRVTTEREKRADK